MTYRVAMDIGGTFTDVVAYDETRGTYLAAKAPTTPGDLAEGVFASLGRAVDEPGDISFFVHGTIQGLNALLERKGARVLLLTSAGMRSASEPHNSTTRARKTPETMPAQRVRAPAETATPVRGMEPPDGRAWKRPPARLA